MFSLFYWYSNMETHLVTGGASFIRSNFILKARKEQWANIINLDKLTDEEDPFGELVMHPHLNALCA